MLAWARSFGDLRHAGVEGTGSYGAALCRYLLSQNVQVIEVNRPDRAARRRSGKSDEVDAEAAARAVLGGRATARPKHTSGTVEDPRVSTTVKDSNATWPANSSDASAPRGINLNTHRAAGMRAYAAAHDWLTIIQLPSYKYRLHRRRTP